MPQLRRFAAPISLAIALAACSVSRDEEPDEQPTAAAPAADANYADEMRSDDMAARSPATIPDPEDRPIMQAQVILDRMGFSPGVIDGKAGASTTNALKAFQTANGMTVSGTLDDATRQALLGTVGGKEAANAPMSPAPAPTATGSGASPTARATTMAPGARAVAATRIVTIPASFASGKFEAIPDEPAKQAEMTRLGYESLDEKLAERFHTTVETLRMLNPGGRPAGAKPESEAAPSKSPAAGASPSGSATAGSKALFKAGDQIRVPNIGADFIDASAEMDGKWRDTLRDLGVGTKQPKAARIVVDKSDGTLLAYDENDTLIAGFTVTTGSSHDPLPLGEWKITGTAYNPPFAYDPNLFWDVPDSAEKQQLPPGPNGPVGVVWIDLSKEHYGIHGTPAPETIGQAQSHGCVRLTNWDAARLALMVSQSTKVVFEA